MKRPKTGTPGDILEAVWKREGISRIELAKLLEVDKSTVSLIVGDFLTHGLVDEYEQAVASSLGGRKPVKLRINGDLGFVVGLEVQPDFCRTVVVNLRGEKLLSRVDPGTTSAANFEARFRGLVDDLLDGARCRVSGVPGRCLGVGLAVSGVVNPFEGTVIESVSLGMRQVKLLPHLAWGLPCPVFLENDANAACWGEVVFQKETAAPLPSFLFCLFEFHQGEGPSDTGGSVGLGLVVNGQIHHGENFSAGEFMSLGWQPGNSFQFSLDDAEMARLRQDQGLLSRFARELAAHILFVSRVFNLNHVCFGGEVGPLQFELDRAFEQEKRRYWPRGDSPCRLRFSAHGGDAVGFGAACLALTSFFHAPGLVDRLATPGQFR